MLGKMMKHEWNAVMKVLLPANLVLVAITIIGRIMVSARVFEADSEIVAVLAGLSLVIYILCLMAVSLCATIFIAFRFYKSVYTDEGYLLHTLPVSTHEITLSKTLVGASWTLITSFVVMLSVFVLVTGCLAPGSWGEIVRECSHLISVYVGPRFTAWVVFFVFLMIVSCFYSVLWLFAGISFGQLLPKHKVLGAFIGFGIIYFAMQIFSFISMFATGTMKKAYEMIDGSTDAVISYMESVYLQSFVLCAIFTVLFYFFTNYMMKKKLNLD